MYVHYLKDNNFSLLYTSSRENWSVRELLWQTRPHFYQIGSAWMGSEGCSGVRGCQIGLQWCYTSSRVNQNVRELLWQTRPHFYCSGSAWMGSNRVIMDWCYWGGRWKDNNFSPWYTSQGICVLLWQTICTGQAPSLYPSVQWGKEGWSLSEGK